MKATLKIPDTIHDMTVEHLPFFMAITKLCPDLSKVDQDFFDNLDQIEIADLNTLFFNEVPGAFDIYTGASNKKILAEIVYSCARYDQNPIQPEITIDDTTYVFNSDFSKMPVSFWRDIKRADFEEFPMDMIAFCYLEKGMTYNEIDKNKNILNERRARGEKLKARTDLAKYLDVQAFFLESWSVLSPYSKAKEVVERKKHGAGKSQSTT